LAANRVSKNSTPVVPRSNLPRPQAIGRSGSSASSRSGGTTASTSDRNKSPVNNVGNEPQPSPQQKSDVSDSDSNPEEDERYDNLLESCFTSGMGIPKSRSEPVDLKSKSLSKLRRDKSSTATSQNKEPNTRERSKSKSPRNSRIIPGVRIAGLKLVSRSGGSSPTTKGATTTTTEVVTTPPTAVSYIKEEEPSLVEPESRPVQSESKPAEQETETEFEGESSKHIEDEPTLMETLTESRVLELEANRVVETVVEHQRQQQQQQQQNHYRLMLARRIGAEDSMNR
jgi:hypothetical protein